MPASHWFRARPPDDARRPGLGARLVVGLDVRVPDAGARHALAAGQPARADAPARGAPADRATAATRGVPWGVSESAYNVRDLELTYQYSNFGVPGLGLKRGLSEDLVIAPYATALAAMVDPARRGREPRAPRRGSARAARYGFYEALDYTPRRVCRRASRSAMVRAYMAHHQGMTIVAHRQRAARRRDAGALPRRADRAGGRAAAPGAHAARRGRRAAAGRGGRGGGRTCATSCAPVAAPLHTRRTTRRRGRICSRTARYAVMLTAAGSGYSRWRDLAVTRWREDVDARRAGARTSSCATWTSGEVWSAGYQPSGVEPDAYEVDLLGGSRARSAGATARSRPRSRSWSRPRTTPRCAASRSRTSARARARSSSPPTPRSCSRRRPPTRPTPPSRSSSCRPSSCPQLNALLATRRPRSPEEPPIWAAHVVAVEGERGRRRRSTRPTARASSAAGAASARRCRSIDGRPLSNTAGSVLDPIFSLRRARPARARAPPRASPSPRWSRRRASAVARPRRQVSATRPTFERVRRRSRWTAGPGRSCTTSASSPTRRICSSASPTASSTPIRRCGRRPRSCDAQRGGAVGALAARHLRRSADRAGAHRRRRGPRDRAPAAARARVLAPEAARRRSRDPERAGHVLRAGSPGGARGAGADEPVAARRIDGHAAHGRRVHPARRPPLARGPARCCRRRRARCCSAGTARSPSRSTRVRAQREAAPPPARRGRARGSRRRRSRRRGSTSSSSTASAASPRTAASTSRSSARGSGRRRRGST